MRKDEVLVALARRMCGEEAARVMALLIGRVEESDEEIAAELGMDVVKVRRILNELFEARLVKYRRARDEKEGWYKYFWRVTDEPPERILEDRKRLLIKLLEGLLDREAGEEYYYCPACGRRYTATEADDLNYTCRKCGEVLEPYDNSKSVDKIKKALEIIRRYQPTTASYMSVF
ncbi:MAG: TFIIB-type zinc ribbon-containing protein [Thermofilum sp.]|uniref:Transcription factor E n=1 Tax=Thermofilum pendens TaxID=2269 RepID=A0A7C4H4M9_THEPE